MRPYNFQLHTKPNSTANLAVCKDIFSAFELKKLSAHFAPLADLPHQARPVGADYCAPFSIALSKGIKLISQVDKDISSRLARASRR